MKGFVDVSGENGTGADSGVLENRVPSTPANLLMKILEQAPYCLVSRGRCAASKNSR
ncbi:MAG: hypothetical protein IANPNBLG_01295 [Bryobacteraceae bacterium]|nr:hypothetical protein [Bryobacteraceae bacterium]